MAHIPRIEPLLINCMNRISNNILFVYISRNIKTTFRQKRLDAIHICLNNRRFIVFSIEIKTYLKKCRNKFLNYNNFVLNSGGQIEGATVERCE